MTVARRLPSIQQNLASLGRNDTVNSHASSMNESMDGVVTVSEQRIRGLNIAKVIRYAIYLKI